MCLLGFFGYFFLHSGQVFSLGKQILQTRWLSLHMDIRISAVSRQTGHSSSSSFSFNEISRYSNSLLLRPSGSTFGISCSSSVLFSNCDSRYLLVKRTPYFSFLFLHWISLSGVLSVYLCCGQWLTSKQSCLFFSFNMVMGFFHSSMQSCRIDSSLSILEGMDAIFLACS